MVMTFGADPVRAAVASLLSRLAEGGTIDARDERVNVDLKEETGRRGSKGQVLPGHARSDAVAAQLADEAACMANTPGGGALIVGVSNDGELIGAVSDAEWLRHRIYELADRRLTVDISEVTIGDARLLIIVAPQALELVKVRGRTKWRVGDHCVDVDPISWLLQQREVRNYDWSAESSGEPPARARAQALEVARDFLVASGEPSANDLAGATDAELLRRLGVVHTDGTLTNAGAIAFVGTEWAPLDYLRRPVEGADSTLRLRTEGRSLLENLREVFAAVDSATATRHLQVGLVMQQVRELPLIAVREAIVNGVAHRDWHTVQPTTVEHIGAKLRVTSPGGFYGGVNERNVLTHPSRSRNQSLVHLLAKLRIAEREGIGVDRMVREMIRIGNAAPSIREIDGPSVRVVLIGSSLDEPWMAWQRQVEPAHLVDDVSALLALHRLMRCGWIDASAAAEVTQLELAEAEDLLLRLSGATMSGAVLIEPIIGTPDGSEPAWRLHERALEVIRGLDEAVGRRTRMPERSAVARTYAAHRGRISSTELAAFVHASNSNVGPVLKQLAADGVLEPSSPTGRGRGFYYRWVERLHEDAGRRSESATGTPG